MLAQEGWVDRALIVGQFVSKEGSPVSGGLDGVSSGGRDGHVVEDAGGIVEDTFRGTARWDWDCSDDKVGLGHDGLSEERAKLSSIG